MIISRNSSHLKRIGIGFPVASPTDDAMNLAFGPNKASVRWFSVRGKIAGSDQRGINQRPNKPLKGSNRKPQLMNWIEDFLGVEAKKNASTHFLASMH